MARPDQCPKCGSLYCTALNKDGSRYDPFKQLGLWDSCKCDSCNHVYPFRIVHLAAEPKQV